jgi:hypothetical protein
MLGAQPNSACALRRASRKSRMSAGVNKPDMVILTRLRDLSVSKEKVALIRRILSAIAYDLPNA